MTLFVDKIIHNNYGAIVTDLKKSEYILAVHRLPFEKILKESSNHTNIPSGMFATGEYIVSFNLARDLSNVNLAFINYKIDLNENFEVFADCMSPKTVAGFHKLQEKLKQKELLGLESVVFSADDSDFVIAYGNYIEHRNHQ